MGVYLDAFVGGWGRRWVCIYMCSYVGGVGGGCVYVFVGEWGSRRCVFICVRRLGAVGGGCLDAFVGWWR